MSFWTLSMKIEKERETNNSLCWLARFPFHASIPTRTPSRWEWWSYRRMPSWCNRYLRSWTVLSSAWKNFLENLSWRSTKEQVWMWMTAGDTKHGLISMFLPFFLNIFQFRQLIPWITSLINQLKRKITEFNQNFLEIQQQKLIRNVPANSKEGLKN